MLCSFAFILPHFRVPKPVKDFRIRVIFLYKKDYLGVNTTRRVEHELDHSAQNDAGYQSYNLRESLSHLKM